MSDDLSESSAAVFASCESIPQETAGQQVFRMRITEVVKGDPKLLDTVIEVPVVESRTTEVPGGGKPSFLGGYWIVGYGESRLQWASAKGLTHQAVSYLRGLRDLPDRGPQRLEYFLTHLQHSDEFVAADAYNEFADASLEQIAGLSDKLDRRWVIAQIRDASVPVHRRRLCWTFLSQCGTTEDIRLLDESIRKRHADVTFDPGMDAALACGIALGGDQALTRIERDYLANPDAEYSDTFAAIKAIRVHGTELNVIPRLRLAASLRLVLDRLELADLVIPDLARWEDWSAIEPIVKLFESATPDNRLVKSAAVLYLKTCPLPAAEHALERLRAIDATAVSAAESSIMFYGGLAAVPVPPPDDDDHLSERRDRKESP
ncbi:MAG: hypothetical protein AAGA03_03100 [Planctomycetota bacterium]